MHTTKNNTLLKISGTLLLISLVAMQMYKYMLLSVSFEDKFSLIFYYLPYIPFLLYCFFFHTKRNGYIAYLVTLFILILKYIYDIATAITVYVELKATFLHYISLLPTFIYLWVSLLLIINCFTRNKVISIITGVFLITNFCIISFQSFIYVISCLIAMDHFYFLFSSVGQFLYVLSFVLFWIPVCLIPSFQKPVENKIITQ